MTNRLALALLALAGLFISGYLWLYKLGKIGTIACGTGGCETVQLSPQSRFLGVEVALIGVLGYAALLVLALLGSKFETRRGRLAAQVADADGRRRDAVHALPQVSRILCHPRDLPEVRGVGGDHRDAVRALGRRVAPSPGRGDMSGRREVPPPDADVAEAALCSNG